MLNEDTPSDKFELKYTFNPKYGGSPAFELMMVINESAQVSEMLDFFVMFLKGMGYSPDAINSALDEYLANDDYWDSGVTEDTNEDLENE